MKMKRFTHLQQVSCLFLCFVFLSVSPAIAGSFKKMDSQGKELPDEADQWAIVLEPSSGLYWEVKTDDESIHSNKGLYSWVSSQEELIATLNKEKFGGFSDWRLPTTDELNGIKKKNEQAPLIDHNYFPNTMPSRYMSMGWCGSKSEYQAESVKFGEEKIQGGKYVMATRGKTLDK